MAITSISTEQIKTIYKIASAKKMVNKSAVYTDKNGNEVSDDELHQLVQGLTGKTKVSQLDGVDAEKVIKALRDSFRGTSSLVSPAGMATDKQKKKIWKLMYDLQELDPWEGKTVFDRLKGFIGKFGKIDMPQADPMRFLKYSTANAIIEGLKKLVDRKAGEINKDE